MQIARFFIILSITNDDLAQTEEGAIMVLPTKVVLVNNCPNFKVMRYYVYKSESVKGVPISYFKFFLKVIKIKLKGKEVRENYKKET